ncbi:hypothetical protein [Massilia sp. YIM B04103]|uniref:hypothetical protein n=1 Tax=Massilia sp. YIM B04103 TaxID=2963106 RepID=UPI00210C96B8|nr:hypothetical protein [Massilia sp. YIM B04103]
MRRDATHSLLFAIFLIFTTSINAQNDHDVSPSPQDKVELICDFIYARYYEAYTYIQDELSSATNVSENGGRKKLALENDEFKAYFVKHGEKILLLELTLKTDYFNHKPIPYFIRSEGRRKNSEHIFFCENDTGIATFDNKKIQNIVIRPNFID